MFDSSKSGKIEKEKVRTILNTLGHTYDDSDLDVLLAAEDTEGNEKALRRAWSRHQSWGIFMCFRFAGDLNGSSPY